jgi:hypothetical protein
MLAALTYEQKYLAEFDETSTSMQVAELSRPYRQFKEDAKKTNKLSGRKQKNKQASAKQMNWFTPFVWAQIETAAVKAGKPWKPSAICREAKKLSPATFSGLTEQVVGRWIDSEAKAVHGTSKWSDSTLQRVVAGNAPGGQSTRAGILVNEDIQNVHSVLMLSGRNHILESVKRSMNGLTPFVRQVSHSPL